MNLPIVPDQKPSFIAIVGPPNAGKTTLFNRLTKSSYRAVNYPGSTVEFASGKANGLADLPALEVCDTPGTYSLFPKSSEEEITLDILYDRPGYGTAQKVLAVVDATQLKRHLFLVEQLQTAGFDVVVALTMCDVLEKEGGQILVEQLSQKLGCPIHMVHAPSGKGIPELVRSLHENPTDHTPAKMDPWNTEQKERVLKNIQEISEEVVQKNKDASSKKSFDLDQVFLHPIWGNLIFFAIMTGLFSSIYWMATPFMDWVDGFFGWLGEVTLAMGPETLWAQFLSNGVVLSMGAVLVFVPQIAILFFGITLLEDSGYLSRAASLIDKPLSKIGMNGRSFVPLLSGYACAIPAMMAARTISSKRDRWITLFVIPLMSCSARLPVYALLLGFLFWGASPWKPGLAMAGLYFFSLLVGAMASWIIQKMIPPSGDSFLMLELPAYRIPHWKTVLRTTWTRCMGYVKKAGPIIFVLAMLIWAASTFPNYQESDENLRMQDSYAAKAGQFIEPVMEPMGGDWRTGTALISAFAAREVFVSALVIVFNVGGADGDEASIQGSLLQKMKTAKAPNGMPLFTVASAIGMLIFFVIALQCISTVGVARKEFGSWKAPIAQLVIFNLVAYALAVAAVQGLRAFGIS